MLKDLVCLITGAGRGIGKAITELFANYGAIVYANDNRAGSIEEWLNLPDDTQTRILPEYFDITDPESVKKAVLKIKNEQGRIDVLVNNAGVAYNERIGMISREHVDKMFRINVLAVIDIIQLVSRVMMRQKSGSIINISSMVGVVGDKNQLAYSASKGAVVALTKSAAKELAPFGIRVNSVAPGLTDTEMFRTTDSKYLQERIGHIGMNRVAKPQDIANACAFLASNSADYISGQIIGVDGCAVI